MQVFTDPPKLCWQVDHSCSSNIMLEQFQAVAIGAKPNLYCEAIELVYGGSPKVCVLVEWKALDRVKSEL